MISAIRVMADEVVLVSTGVVAGKDSSSATVFRVPRIDLSVDRFDADELPTACRDHLRATEDVRIVQGFSCVNVTLTAMLWVLTYVSTNAIWPSSLWESYVTS